MQVDDPVLVDVAPQHFLLFYGAELVLSHDHGQGLVGDLDADIAVLYAVTDDRVARPVVVMRVDRAANDNDVFPVQDRIVGYGI